MEEAKAERDALAYLPVMVARDKRKQLLWTCAICTKVNQGDDSVCVVCGRTQGKIPAGFLPFHPQFKTWEGAGHGMEYRKWEALLSAGTDPNITDSDGWTGLHWATAFGREDLVHLMLQYNAPVNATRKDGWTALHIACQGDFVDCVNVLTEHGGDVNALTFTESMSPLHIAALEGNHKVVSALLARNLDVNAKMKRSGWTPLHLAAMRGHLDVVRVLLSTYDFADGINDVDDSRIANINAYDFDGWTPAHIATLRGHTIVSDYFKSHGGGEDANSKACEEYVKSTRAVGVKQSIRDFQG